MDFLRSLPTRRVCDAAIQGDVEGELTKVNSYLIPDVLLSREGNLHRWRTPLTVAASYGNTEAVRVLLKYQNKFCGGDLMSRSNTNTFQALYEAATYEQVVVVKTILRFIDDVNRVGCSEETALHTLCRCKTDVKSEVESLISRGAKLDIADAKGETCLFKACREGREDVVQLLLTKGADPNHRSLSLATPLHAAATRDDHGVARLLLHCGALVFQDAEGYTPLLWAAFDSSSVCVQFFLTLPEFSRQEKIDALELLGAVLSPSEHGGSYTYLKMAMDERYRDPAHIIPKHQRPPVVDLGSVVESQTPQELESRQHDWYKLGLEGLLVMERILGEDNKLLMKTCDLFCYALIHKQRYEETFAVWKYSRKNAVYHSNLDSSGYHIRKIVHAMQSGVFPPTFLRYHDVLHLTVQEMEVQARAAEQNGEYLRYADRIVSSCVGYILSALPLASSDGDLNQLQDVTRRLISVAPLLHTDPVIHVAWSHTSKQMSALPEDLEFTATIASFFAFLVKCGADVSGKDCAHNTLLHRICGRDEDELKAACSMARLFLKLGADVDARNGRSQTPLEVASSEDMRAVLLEHYPVSLKCLAALAIVQSGIPFQGRVPSAVESFIRIHDSC